MINPLDKLFAFPIIMIDGDNEERKASKRDQYGSLGINNSDDDDEEIDVIIGEAECPYYDFVSISDRWLPTHESLQKAITERKFEACNVVFAQAGTFMVPWSKKRFKKELSKFMETQPQAMDIELSILPKDLEKILKETDIKRDRENNV